MPQIFQVLRCYKCMVFQVHFTKKSNKWECKMCGEKQSIKRHYGIGTAKDCRLHVQRLNGIRGEIIERSDSDNDEEEPVKEFFNAPIVKRNHKPIVNSKWSNYVEEEEIVQENSNENTLGDAEVVLEIPKKKRKFTRNFKRNTKSMPLDSSLVQEDYKTDNLPTPPIPTTSKAPLQEVQSDNLVTKEDLPNLNKSAIKKKFVPPLLNENSKWAQFTDNSEGRNGEPETLSELFRKDSFFSLCDDSVIDNVLYLN